MNSSSGHAGHDVVAKVTLRSRGARWGRTLAAGVTVGLLGALAACGGNETTFYIIGAFAELGQPGFTTGVPNALTNGNSGATNANGQANPGTVAVATDSSGNTYTYVADSGNNRIIGWVTPATKSLTNSFTTPAQFVIGQASLTANLAGSTASNLSSPSSVRIFTDSTGEPAGLVVADTGNSRVLIWNVMITSANASTAPVVAIGQTSLTASQANQGSSAPAAGTLSGPTDAMIANGNLFVADNGNDRVLIYSGGATVTTGQSANVVLGQPDFVTDENKCIGNYTIGNTGGAVGGSNAACYGPGSPQNNVSSYTTQANQLVKPTGLWTNGSKLFVADTGNNRVLYYPQLPVANASGAGTAAQIVIGVTNFGTYSAGTNGATGLRGPTGVAGGAAGFYVADTGNNRVLYYASNSPKSNAPAAAQVFGQSDFTHDAADDSDQNGVPDTYINSQGGSVYAPQSSTLYGPTAVSVFNGVVYVTDNGNNRIMEYAGS